MKSGDDLKPHLERLPIFPLPDVVFFPRTNLPLHVFEPRYRQLVRDALDQGLPIAVPRLDARTGRDEYDRPAVCSVAGAGFITTHHALADGRFFVELEGVARVGIQHELPPDKPYRVVSSELLPDHGYELTEAASRIHTLRLLIRGLQPALPEGARVLAALTREQGEPGVLADRVASVLLSDPDQRQRLLEDPNPVNRLAAVIDRLSELMATKTSNQSRPLN